MKKILLLLCSWASFCWLQAQQLPAYFDVRNLYDEAMELYDKNLFGAANAKWENFLAYEPSSPLPQDLFANARYYRAVGAYFLGQQDLLPLMEDFIEKHPYHSEVPYIHFCLGMYHFDRGSYKECQEHLDKASHAEIFKTKNPQYLSALDRDKMHFALGYSYLLEADHMNATDRMLRLTSHPNPYYNDALYYKALMDYYEGKNFQDAYDGFEKIADNPKYRKQAQLVMAYSLFRLKKYAELQTFADRLLKEDKGNGSPNEVYFIAAHTAYEQGNYLKATEYYEKLEKGKYLMDRTTQLRHGYARYKLANYTKAIPLFQNVITSPEDSITQAASYYLGFCLQKERKDEDALFAYKKAGVMTKGGNPDMAKDARYQYAKLAFATHNNTVALKALKELNDDFPNDPFIPEVRELIGEIFSYSQNYVDAIGFFESTPLTSARAKLSYQTACYYYGLEFLKKDDFAAADGYLKKAANMSSSPQIALSANYWLGESLFKRRKFTEALNQYTLMKNTHGAKQNPHYLLAIYGMAWSQFKNKNYSQANTLFEELLKEGTIYPLSLPYESDANARIGDGYFIKKEYNKAVKAYQKVIDLDYTGKDYALFQIGESHYRTGKYDQAITSFDKLITQHKESELRDDGLDRIAEILLTWKKNSVRAETYSLMLTQNYPRSPLAADAYNRLGIIAYEKNDPAASIRYFKKVLDDFTFDTKNAKIALDNLSGIVEPQDFDRLLTEYKAKNPHSNDEISEVTLNTGRNRFYSGSYASAIEFLNNFLSANTKSKHYFEALFLRAESYRATTQQTLALADYQKIYDQPVQNEYISKALDAAARIKYDQKDYNASLELYKNLDKNTQVASNKISAKFGLARNYMAKKDYVAAMTYLKAIEANKEAEREETVKAWLWLGSCYYALKQYEEAKKYYTQVKAEGQDEFGAEAQFMMVRTLYDQGKYTESIDEGRDMKNTYMDSEWKDRAILWMAKSNIALNNVFQAKSLLEEVVQETTYPDIKKFAEDALQELKSVQP